MFLITIRREFSSLKNIYLETVKNKQMHVDPKQLEVVPSASHRSPSSKNCRTISRGPTPPGSDRVWLKT